jgi:signal peptidase II
MKSLPRLLVTGLTLLGCVGCDQVTKHTARTFLSPGATHSFLGDGFRLQLAENPGAFLSIGANLSPDSRTLLFTAAVGLVLLVLVGVALFAKLSMRESVAVALIAGGGIGNLIDRIVHDGLVTDFLNVGIGALRTGIFNLADMLIIAGALVLVLFHRKKPVPAD